VEVDHLKDWLVVEYDSSKVTAEDMLKTIEQQKFTGKIVKTP
jgi:predicted RNA-binding protein